jgi:hypothetical protein
MRLADPRGFAAADRPRDRFWYGDTGLAPRSVRRLGSLPVDERSSHACKPGSSRARTPKSVKKQEPGRHPPGGRVPPQARPLQQVERSRPNPRRVHTTDAGHQVPFRVFAAGQPRERAMDLRVASELPVRVPRNSRSAPPPLAATPPDSGDPPLDAHERPDHNPRCPESVFRDRHGRGRPDSVSVPSITGQHFPSGTLSLSGGPLQCAKVP